METKLNNILYIVIAIGLFVLVNYLLIKPIVKREPIKDNYPSSEINYKKLDVETIETKDNYTAYKLKKETLDYQTQEWQQVKLNDMFVINFQYQAIDKELSQLNIYINDIKINWANELTESDKYNLYFHQYGPYLVLEHRKFDGSLPLIKIYNYETKEVKKLTGEKDFYINQVLVDCYGISTFYSRQTSSLSYLTLKGDYQYSFTLNDQEIMIDGCNKSSWDASLISAPYVSYNELIPVNDSGLDFDNIRIEEKKDLTTYMAPYESFIKEICRKIS